MEVQPGQGRGGGGLEPVLAGVVRALGLHHVEGVGVPRLGARVTLGLVVHLTILLRIVEMLSGYLHVIKLSM